jgi:hypothetical protein
LWPPPMMSASLFILLNDRKASKSKVPKDYEPDCERRVNRAAGHGQHRFMRGTPFDVVAHSGRFH